MSLHLPTSLSLVVALVSAQALATPNPPPHEGEQGGRGETPCEYGKALYDPDRPQASTPDSREWMGDTLLGTLRDTPVGFALTGDECAGPVPLYAIPGSVDPQPTTHDMARRLAPVLANYSNRTGYEGCARMCLTSDGEVAARLVTARSHISCSAPERTCPVGTSPTPQTIHSHPPQTVFIANAVDEVGWRQPGMVGKLMHSGNANALSPEDRTAAPVWVVGGHGRLIWLDRPDGQEVERP